LKGLQSRSRRPHSFPARKVFKKETGHILFFRKKRNLGARRIQNELRRLYEIRLSTATIHKVLVRSGSTPLRKIRRKKACKRYARPIPGERIQMDTCKVAPGLYQYTAIDDCTRYQVLALFPGRKAKHTIEFIDQVMEEMPFPIQRVQTDRGSEFFAYKVQRYMMEIGIKFRPIKPRSPHLNGKVERAHKTALDEFYTTADLNSCSISDHLSEWQHFYNWERGHGAHNGKSPMDRYFELIQKTPYSDEVALSYDPSNEHFRARNYQDDLRLKEMREGLG
jgi:transposase InsO family protein